MSAPRIITAGPMRHGDILPLIREVGSLRERGEYGIAAELEERIRQPITVAGRVLECDADAWSWYGATPETTLMLSVNRDEWHASLSANVPCGAMVSAGGFGHTIAAALADARDRYQAAIADTLLRMSGLLREVVS